MLEYSTLRVQPGASRGLTGLLVGAHLAAIAIVWLTLSKWWLSGPLSMVIAVSLVDVLRVHALRTSRRAVTCVDLEAGGAVAVHFRQMPAAAGRLLGSSFVSPGLVILRIRMPSHSVPLSIVITAGSLPRQDFRRLRVWLRWRPLHAEPGAAVHPGGDNPLTG